MDKAEIVKLREFLRKAFSAVTVQVTPNSRRRGRADVGSASARSARSRSTTRTATARSPSK